MIALALALAHFLWQGALLGAVATILQRTASRPTTRYAIGTAALAAMLISVPATVLVLGRSDQAPAAASFDGFGLNKTGQDIPAAFVSARPIATHAVDSVRSVAAADLLRALHRPGLARAIVGTWLLGILVFTIRLIGAWIVTRRLAARAIGPISAELEVRIRTIAQRLGLTASIRVLKSAAISAPAVVGWFRPVVIMPVAVLSGFSVAQIDALIAHELAHLRRHDAIVNLLQSLVETLLFYHPAVWWISGTVRREREQCCDDLAISITGDRLVYATALADLATIARGRPFVVAATGGSLTERVARALSEPMPRSSAPAAGAAVLLVAMAVASLTPVSASSFEVPDVKEPASLRPAVLRSAMLPTLSVRAPQAPVPQLGSLEGRVLTPTGDGVREVHVRLLSRRVIGGRDYLMPIHWGERMATLDGMSETTAAGAFVFSSVQPGRYFLVAQPEPFSRSAYTYMFPPAEGPTGYAPAYYPSVARAADAKPIDIAAGQAVRDIVITVSAVQTGSILVEPIPATPGSSQYAMTDIYLAPNGELQKAIAMQRRGPGPLLFEHVPAGQYILSIDPQRRVMVRPGETTTVTVLLKPLPMLRAKVTVEGPGAPPPMREVAVRFEPTDEVQAVMYTALHAPVYLSDQGEFRLFEWMPAILRVDPPSGWALRRIMLNGRDITDLAIDFSQAPEGLEFVLTAAR